MCCFTILSLDKCCTLNVVDYLFEEFQAHFVPFSFENRPIAAAFLSWLEWSEAGIKQVSSLMEKKKVSLLKETFKMYHLKLNYTWSKLRFKTYIHHHKHISSSVQVLVLQGPPQSAPDKTPHFTSHWTGSFPQPPPAQLILRRRFMKGSLSFCSPAPVSRRDTCGRLPVIAVRFNLKDKCDC